MIWLECEDGVLFRLDMVEALVPVRLRTPILGGGGQPLTHELRGMHPIPGTIHWTIARSNEEVISGLRAWIRDQLHGRRFLDEALVIRAVDYAPLADFNALDEMLGRGAWSQTLGGDVRPGPHEPDGGSRAE